MDMETTMISTTFYPSSYDSNSIISVSSINQSGELSGNLFSNYGLDSVDIAAQGENIRCATINRRLYSTITPDEVGGLILLGRFNRKVMVQESFMVLIIGSKVQGFMVHGIASSHGSYTKYRPQNAITCRLFSSTRVGKHVA